MTTPLAESIRIVFVGLRNAGKSSLLNRLFEREVAIVSGTPGTTTDPVTRPMELAGLGPVAVTDTAGLDDEGELGDLRVAKTRERLAAADIVVLASPADRPPHPLEEALVVEAAEKGKALVLALTFSDHAPDLSKKDWAADYSPLDIDNLSGKGVADLRERLVALKDRVAPEPTPLEGLVGAGDLVLLIVPIDLAAPKGRLILPQVETIRDALDRDASCLVVKERELAAAYADLERAGRRPRLVVTDSQAFSKVAADIPADQPLTSFSILFARKKGELAFFLEGLDALKTLARGARILVLEACSHHRQPDDIGTVKIPRLFRQLADPTAVFEWRHDLPDDTELRAYDLVIHCAACMLTRKRMVDRLERLRSAGVPITNYGMFLAWANGLIPRALEPLGYEKR